MLGSIAKLHQPRDFGVREMTELFEVSLRGYTETVDREGLDRILASLTDLKGLTFTVIKK